MDVWERVGSSISAPGGWLLKRRIGERAVECDNKEGAAAMVFE